jgi:tRNA(fMet)-specific endonuclease VapC
MTEPIAVRFAEIRALLTRRGELISDFDLLIGATALHYEHPVLTCNLKHFSRRETCASTNPANESELAFLPHH